MFGTDNILMGLPVMSVVLTDSFNLFQGSGQEDNAPWWLVWLLVIIALLAMLVSWLVQRSEKKAEAVPVFTGETATPVSIAEAETVSADETEVAAPVPVTEIPTPTADTSAAAPDNLTRIEGIGPKIASLLQDAGITTFAQLADTDVSHLKQILEAANLRLAEPATWPEQAKLATAGEWESLQALQDQLKGGRRMQTE